MARTLGKYRHPLTGDPINKKEWWKLIKQYGSPEDKLKLEEYNKRQMARYYTNHNKALDYHREYREKNRIKLRQWQRNYFSNPILKEKRRKYMRKNRQNQRKIVQANLYKMSVSEYNLFKSKCYLCGFDKYPCDIHHIDKNNQNNIKENLLSLCPNCHLGIHRKYITIK